MVALSPGSRKRGGPDETPSAYSALFESPNTTRPTPLHPIAPAHIGHGSALLNRVHPARNTRGHRRDAFRTTSSSACPVQSPKRSRVFTPSSSRVPSDPTSTAPYGWSPASTDLSATVMASRNHSRSSLVTSATRTSPTPSSRCHPHLRAPPPNPHHPRHDAPISVPAPSIRVPPDSHPHSLLPADPTIKIRTRPGPLPRKKSSPASPSIWTDGRSPRTTTRDASAKPAWSSGTLARWSSGTLARYHAPRIQHRHPAT